MKIYKIFANDFRFHHSFKSLIIIAAVALLFLIQCGRGLDDLFGHGMISCKGTVADYFLYFFLGTDPFDPTSGDRHFQIPLIWLFEIIILLLVNLHYTSNDFSYYGYQLIARSKKRVRWWVAKCFSLSASCIIQLAVLCAAISTVALTFGAEFTLSVTPDFAEMLLPDICLEQLSSLGRLKLTLILCLPVLTILTLNFLQCLLCMFFKPAVSFLITMFIPIVSVYFASPALICNYAMFARIAPFLCDGVSLPYGIIANFAVITIVVIVGAFKVSSVNFI